VAPDAETAMALTRAAPKLSTLSAERLWSESGKILGTPDPRTGLRLMDDLGVWSVLLPEALAGWPARLDQLAEAAAPAAPLLRLAAIIGDAARADRLARRWKLSNAERERLSVLLTGDLPEPDASRVALIKALAETSKEILIDRSFLRHKPGAAATAFRARLALLTPPVFPLRGRDAVALGLSSGPPLGEALRAVRAWWIDRGCTDDAAACRAELARRAGVAGRPAS
jgi:poly(A) polymerase